MKAVTGEDLADQGTFLRPLPLHLQVPQGRAPMEGLQCQSTWMLMHQRLLICSDVIRYDVI